MEWHNCTEYLHKPCFRQDEHGRPEDVVVALYTCRVYVTPFESHRFRDMAGLVRGAPPWAPVVTSAVLHHNIVSAAGIARCYTVSDPSASVLEGVVQ